MFEVENLEVWKTAKPELYEMLTTLDLPPLPHPSKLDLTPFTGEEFKFPKLKDVEWKPWLEFERSIRSSPLEDLLFDSLKAAKGIEFAGLVGVVLNIARYHPKNEGDWDNHRNCLCSLFKTCENCIITEFAKLDDYEGICWNSDMLNRAKAYLGFDPLGDSGIWVSGRIRVAYIRAHFMRIYQVLHKRYFGNIG